MNSESLPYTEDKSLELRHMSGFVCLSDVSFQNGVVTALGNSFHFFLTNKQM